MDRARRILLLGLLLLPAASSGAQSTTDADLRQQEFLAKHAVKSMMETSIRSTEYGEAMLGGSKPVLITDDFTDEANQLIAEFAATFMEKDKNARESQQKALIERLDGIVVLKTAKAGGTTKKPGGGASVSQAPVEDLRLSESQLFRETLEEVTPRYAMPVELTTEEAVALIRDVQGLESHLQAFPKQLLEYKGRMSHVVNVQVQNGLWQRLVSNQGFKDSGIGQDWYVVAVEHLSLIGAVEDLLGTGAELAGVAIASNRLSGVRMRLIGSRVTLGDRAFVRGALAWLQMREEQIQKNRERIIILEQRLKTEGVLAGR